MVFDYQKEYNELFETQPTVELQEINLWFV